MESSSERRAGVQSGVYAEPLHETAETRMVTSIPTAYADTPVAQVIHTSSEDIILGCNFCLSFILDFVFRLAILAGLVFGMPIVVLSFSWLAVRFD